MSYGNERTRLRSAIAAHEIDPEVPLGKCFQDLEKILGWDSWLDGGDWVELEMEAQERNISVSTVQDFLHLLDVIAQ